MKQLFLPLALLTSGFVYSADPNAKVVEYHAPLAKKTFAETDFSIANIKVLKSLVEFRGMEEPKMEDSAVEALYSLMKPDENMVYKPIDIRHYQDSTHSEWLLRLTSQKDGKTFEVKWKAQNNSLKFYVFDEVFNKLMNQIIDKNS